MAKKLSMMINRDHPEVCRAVILEDGRINDYIVENVSQEKIKGNIYLGVINRVEPAIEAAFVDIGGSKYGFLPFKDVLKETYVDTGEKKARVRIQDVLVRGQEILVQVSKESRDAKGPSLTNSISLPGRFLVLMSGSHASAVSRKIEDEEERKKLKSLVADFKLPENLGLIIRTAGVGRTKIELQKDLQRLLMVWENLSSSREKNIKKPPFLLYQEADMVVRLVRDNFTTETSEVLVDNIESFNAVKNFMKMVMPRLTNRVKLYKETTPIFSRFNIESQIESLYQRKVSLPSGGSIVFDSGEAMVSIDVNSGKTTSASQLEETAFTTNMEAAEEIGRQLRLRDLGGLVVIDFIDMSLKKNQSSVEKEIKKICKLDKARVNIARISKFGLLEMSRQRLAPPVQQGAFVDCNSCAGTGVVRSLNYVVIHVLRKINEHLASGKVKQLNVEVSSQVVEYMINNKAVFLLDLQEKLKFKLEFLIKPNINWNDFKYLVKEKTSEELEKVELTPNDPLLQTTKLNVGKDQTRQQSRGNNLNRNRRSRPIHEEIKSVEINTNDTLAQTTKPNGELEQTRQQNRGNDLHKARRSRPPQRKRFIRRTPDRKTLPSKDGNVYQKGSDLIDPKVSLGVTPLKAPIVSPSLTLKETSKPDAKSENLIDRITGFFGKA
jgi:ribonuclease E